MPGGTVAMAQSLGIAPTPERARFVAELARLTHPSAESASTTRARAAASLRARLGHAALAGAAADTVPIPLTVDTWSQAVFRRTIAPEAHRRRDPRGSACGASLPWSRRRSTTRRCSTWPITRRSSRGCTSAMRRRSPHSAAACAFTATACVPPGGADAAALWEAVVGEKLERPDAFVRAALRAGRRTPGVSVRHHRRAGCAAGGVRARPVDQGSRRARRSGSRRWPSVNRRRSRNGNREAAVHPAALRRRLDAGARPGRAGRVAVVPRRRDRGGAGRSTSGELPPAAARPESLADDGPVDAAWLAEDDRVGRHAQPKRAARSARVRPAGVRRAPIEAQSPTS